MDSRARPDRLRCLLLEGACHVAEPVGDTDCARLRAGLADGLRGGPLGVPVNYSGSPEPGSGTEALLRVVREYRPGYPVLVKAWGVADGSSRLGAASFRARAAARRCQRLSGPGVFARVEKQFLISHFRFEEGEPEERVLRFELRVLSSDCSGNGRAEFRRLSVEGFPTGRDVATLRRQGLSV